MIATTVVAVGFLIADILIRRNWLAALCLVLYDCIVLVPGAILLLKPEWSFNHSLKRVNGHWKSVKIQNHPNLISGLIIFITVLAVNLKILLS